MLKRRLVIGHFSVIHDNNMNACFDLLVQTLFELDNCAEIRIQV
jgi:hypothetical protein